MAPAGNRVEREDDLVVLGVRRRRGEGQHLSLVHRPVTDGVQHRALVLALFHGDRELLGVAARGIAVVRDSDDHRVLTDLLVGRGERERARDGVDRGPYGEADRARR